MQYDDNVHIIEPRRRSLREYPYPLRGLFIDLDVDIDHWRGSSLPRLNQIRCSNSCLLQPSRVRLFDLPLSFIRFAVSATLDSISEFVIGLRGLKRL